MGRFLCHSRQEALLWGQEAEVASFPAGDRRRGGAHRNGRGRSGGKMKVVRGSVVAIAIVLAAVLLLPATALASAAAPRSGAAAMSRSAFADLTSRLDDGALLSLTIWVSSAPAKGRLPACEIHYLLLSPVSAEDWQVVGQASGSASLPVRALNAAGASLRKARLSVRVPLVWADETPWGDATVKLTWTGSGSVSRETWRQRTVEEDTGLALIVTNVSRSRDAVVGGSVTLPDGRAVPGAELDGSLHTTHAVTVPFGH